MLKRYAPLLAEAVPTALPHCTLGAYAKQMPMIGMGTFTGTRFTQKAQPGDMERLVGQWIDLGGRMIDGAQNYLNEAEIGAAVTKAIAEKKVTRDELWLTSKLNNPYHRKEHVREACEKTLLDLNVDYVDLYLLHWPTAFVHVPFSEHDLRNKGLSQEYEPDMCSGVTGVKWQDLDGSWPPPHLDMKVTIHETWAAMEQLVCDGLVKNIGVCNTQVQLLHELLCGATVKPAVVQHESHVYLQQWGLLKYCQMNQIQFQAYSPLGYGEFVGADEVKVLEHPVLQGIARKHGLDESKGSVAAVCLQWCTQRGVATMYVERARVCARKDLENI